MSTLAASRRYHVSRSLALGTLVLAITLAAPRGGHCAPAVWTKVTRALHVKAKPVVRGTSELTKGTLIDGPKHTWHAIKSKPLRYGAMLLGIGAIGAGAKALGIDPEPYALGLSAATLGWAVWKTVPAMKAERGAAKLRSIGANVLWPSALAVGSSVAGMQVGHAKEAATISAADVARAGAQSTVIGIDVPTIAQTALDQPAKGAKH